METQPDGAFSGVVGRKIKGGAKMKRIVCLLLGALLLTGCAGAPPAAGTKTEPQTAVESTPAAQIPAVEGYDDFAAVLSAAVLDGKGNKNLSPVSAYIALAMAAEGARGDTRAELLALLGAKNAEDMRKSAEEMLKTLSISGKSSELILADSIWLGKQAGAAFYEDYLALLSRSYDAEADAVYFGTPEAAARIAAWIREKTREKVKISDDVMEFDADTIAVLINTIYLKDGWRTPFDENLTEKGTFCGPDGERQVQYMRRTDAGGAIVRGDGYLRYAMDLREAGTMVFVLPDEGVSLDSLLGSPEGIRELLTGGDKSVADVSILLPKFSFQDRTDLEETLMGLGVRTCFSGGADFSGMTDMPAHISRALQESYVGVDENGVTAAAYTLIAMTKGAAIPVEREKIDFHLTRPFLYAVESADGTVLFIGTVTAPDEA